jgi:hypothetical protein
MTGSSETGDLSPLHPQAILVRKLLRSAYKIVEAHEAHMDSDHMLGIASSPLGRLMTCSDYETAFALAREIEGEEPLLALIENIRFGWGISKSSPKHTERETLLDACYNILEIVARVHTKSEHRLLKEGSLATQWKRIAEHFPGRDPFSLRDDYVRLSISLCSTYPLSLRNVADGLTRLTMNQKIAA